MRPLRQKILLTAYAAAAFYAAVQYFSPDAYPLPGFFSRLRETAAAAIFLLMAASVGKKALKLFGLDSGFSLPVLLWSAGLGMVPISLSLLALGSLSLFRAAAFLILTLVFILAAIKETSGWALWFWEVLRRGKGGNALFFFAMTVLSVGLLCAWAPPTYYDSLVYHLALPAKYLQEGRVGFVPYNHYAHFPQNMEMIFAWFLAIGSDVSAQVFNVLTAALLGLFLFDLGRATSAKPGFRWDLLLLLTAPCLLLLSTETYVEAPLALWTCLSLRAAARGLGFEAKIPPSRAWFVLAGIFGGFAAGIKYTGALTPALLFFFLLLWPRRAGASQRLKDAALLGAPAFLVFLPWLVKNYVLTGGNPVFPFLPSLFPAENVYMYAESSKAYFKVLDEYKGTSSLLLELFALPIKMIKDPVALGGGYDVTGDLGWALPVILLPLSLLLYRKSVLHRFLLSYALAHIVLWGSLRPVLRFLFPIFPVACLLCGQGAGELLSRLPRAGRALAVGFMSLFFLSNGLLFYMVERVRDPFQVALGLQTRHEYLMRKMDMYGTMSFIRESLPRESRLLFVGDQRAYYCARPYLAPMALLPQPLREWAEQAGDAQSLREKLLELGFTHVYFNRREAERTKSYRVLDLTPRGLESWNRMIETIPRAYQDENAAVYILRSISTLTLPSPLQGEGGES